MADRHHSCVRYNFFKYQQKSVSQQLHHILAPSHPTPPPCHIQLSTNAHFDLVDANLLAIHFPQSVHHTPNVVKLDERKRSRLDATLMFYLHMLTHTHTHTHTFTHNQYMAPTLIYVANRPDLQRILTLS